MKQLITFFGWVPVLGTTLKVSYLTKCAHDILTKINIPTDQANANAEHMEKVIHDLSEEAYNEHLYHEVSKIGLPGFMQNKIREKLTGIITNHLKNKYISKTSN
jgi:hypothetical protein